MSSPVVTALPDETVAEAADPDARPQGRLGRRRRRRPRRSASSPSATWCAGARRASTPAASKVAEWMTERPRHASRPTLDGAGGLRLASPRTATATSPSSTTAALVGIVSIRDLMRIASIQPVVHPARIEAPPGARGRRSSPRPTVGDVRGLEGFYHYRQYNAVELADKRRARGRLVPAVRGPPARPRPSATRSSTRSGRCARSPTPVAAVLPAIADAASHVDHGGACAPRCRSSAPPRASGRPSTSTTPSARRNALQVCAVIPTLIMALHRLKPGRGADRPAPRPRLRRQLPLDDDAARSPTPRSAAAVEQYQITTIDHGFNASTFTARVITLDRRRRRRRGRRRHRRAVGPAARRRARAGPSTCSTPSAPPRTPGPYLVDAVEPRRADHGLRPPRLQDRRPPLAVPARRRRAHRRREGRVRQAGRADRRRRAGRAEARPQPLRQRRVLRRRGDGPLRPAPRAVHADVRVEPGDRLVRQHPRAGRRQPHHPAQRPLRRPAAAPARPRRVSQRGRPMAVIVERRHRGRTPTSSVERLRAARPPARRVEPAADRATQVAEMLASPAISLFVARRRRRHDRRHRPRWPCSAIPTGAAGLDRGRHHRRGRPRPGRRRGAHPGRCSTGPASSARAPSTSPAAPAARPPTASTSGSASSSARRTSTGSTSEPEGQPLPSPRGCALELPTGRSPSGSSGWRSDRRFRTPTR